MLHPLVRGNAGSKGEHVGSFWRKPRWIACSEGRSLVWMCSCVVEVVAEVGRRRRTQRSACRCFHPKEAAGGDGGLASHGRRARKRHVTAASERAARAGLWRKTSRDRTHSVTIRARARVSPSDERHFGSRRLSHRHGEVGKAVSAASGNVIARKRRGGEWGGDRDVRGTAQRKCQGEIPFA